MYTKLCVLLLAVSLCHGVSRRLPPAVPLTTGASLAEYLVRNRAISQENPARALSCIESYTAASDAALAEYTTAYTTCLDQKTADLAKIDDTTKPQRDLIDSEATNTCDALSACQKSTDSVKYFECYAKAAGDNSKTLYTISSNSTALLVVVRQQYQVIENDCEVCTNKTEQVYGETLFDLFAEMNACLTGKPAAPPVTDAPSTATSEASTTEASSSTDSSTSEDSSSAPTDAPSSPESTTDAPSSPESTTDAPSSPASSTDAPSSPASSTDASTESAESTTASQKENLPEEDLSRLLKQESNMKAMIENFKKWLTRN